jgi:hypothetical protein
LTVFSLDLHTNDLTRNGGLFVSSFLEPFLDRSEVKQTIITLILAAGMHAVSAYAGLGWTLAECKQHYGSDGIANGKNDIGLDTYNFSAQGYQITVGFAPDKSGYVITVNYVGSDLDDETINKILTNNVPKGTIWSKEGKGLIPDQNKPTYWNAGGGKFFAILTQMTVFGTPLSKLQVSTGLINSIIEQKRKSTDL